MDDELRTWLQESHDVVGMQRPMSIRPAQVGTGLQLTVKVEPHLDVADQRTTRQRAATDVQREIKSYIGVSAAVVIRDPGTVERSIGKAKRVIDARARS